MKLTHHQKHSIRHWFLFRAENMVAALEQSESDPCDLCADHGWWEANGYTEAERIAICAYLCPPQES